MRFTRSLNVSSYWLFLIVLSFAATGYGQSIKKGTRLDLEEDTIHTAAPIPKPNPPTFQAANTASDRFVLISKDTVVHLAHEFVTEGTEQVFLNGKLLKEGEYALGARFGTLKVRTVIVGASGIDGKFRDTLTVSYHYLPFTFQESYRHRIPYLRKDSVTGKTTQVAKNVSSFNLDDIFGAGLQKSGSIVRGFSLGTNRDLSLSSGFRMQMSGKVSDNVDVLAALTDENIPLQPEGTTQNLQEIDKVFIEIRGANLGATLGDFILSSDGTEFGSYSRKVQGAKGDAAYRTSFTGGTFTAAAAATRGKYASNQIQGLDAVQGPYRLTGKGNERDIIVIAGTERVYLNGEQMVRGENKDYTIDYSIGEITFTPARIIGRASRITVDYQYTDRQFNRNLLAASGGNSFFGERLKIKAGIMRETDDKDSPVEVTLADSDRAVLAAAGGDPNKATRSGVTYAGPGQGQYIKIDTSILVAGTTLPVAKTIYRYAPSDSLNAVYAVAFTFVGLGAGDYNRVAAGQYQFAGVNAGSYAPIRFLPLPESRALTDVSADWKVTPNLTVSGEGAFSQYERNQFSTLADAKLNGSAMNGAMHFVSDSLVIGGSHIGGLDVSARARSVTNTFTPLDRVDQPEFSRSWNLENSTGGAEELQEGSAKYSPVREIQISGGLGHLRKAGTANTNKYNGGLLYKNALGATAEYTTELLKSTDKAAATSCTWLRDKASGEMPLGFIVPGIRYEHEYRKQDGATVATGSDSGTLGSFRFHEITPRILFPKAAGFKVLGEVGLRLEDSLYLGTLTKAARSVTERVEIQPPSSEEFNSSIMMTFRNKKYTDEFRLRNADAATTLLRLQARYTPFHRAIETDWFYDAASERSAKNERVFQQVPKGTGNYIYLGDLNNNHIADEEEFQLARFDGNYVSYVVPSEQFIPVTDLRASTRIRINGNRLFEGAQGIGGFFSQLSTETALRVNEKSTVGETEKIYFLHFSDFLNEKTTLEGSNQYTQDVFFRETASDYSLRLRFDQKHGYTQFSAQNERAYSREQSFRFRWRLVEEIANQIDFAHRTDNLSSTQLSFRVRSISGNTLAMDWSYRPEQRYELGFKFGVGALTNGDTTTADLNDQGVRFTYSIESKGQFRAEFNREEALIGHQGTYLPFELTNGRVAGKTWLWRANFDYRVTKFIQGTVTYDGRSENGGTPIHTGRAEVKAFF